MSDLKYRLKAVGLAVGYFVSCSILALFEEQIFKNNYSGEKFVFPVTLAVIQCLANAIFSKVIILTTNQEQNETPQKFYIIVSIFYMLAMMTTNMAYVFVPYVLLVIGKACKPIPVMILTALIAKKIYTIQRYFFVTIIAFGIGLFVYKDDMPATESNLIGKTLIIASLLLEGLLGAAQATMRNSSKPSSLNYMCYVNFWSAIFCLPFLIVNFEIFNFIPFCMRHNEVILYVAAAILSGIVTHYFQSAMISNYGPLPYSLVSTTRKFFTVLFSSLIFGNVFSLRQWIATVIIFHGLILDALFGKKKSSYSVDNNKNEIVFAIDGSNNKETIQMKDEGIKEKENKF